MFLSPRCPPFPDHFLNFRGVVRRPFFFFPRSPLNSLPASRPSPTLPHSPVEWLGHPRLLLVPAGLQQSQLLLRGTRRPTATDSPTPPSSSPEDDLQGPLCTLRVASPPPLFFVFFVKNPPAPGDELPPHFRPPRHPPIARFVRCHVPSPLGAASLPLNS